jgi:probable F420-dependent oxidoreductase
MQFSIALAYNRPEDLPALARAAEEAGFGSVILSDHLIYPETRETPYPYTKDGQMPWQADTPWPDPLVVAASLGAVTKRLRFIVSVMILPLRNPVLAAKSIMTTSVMTGGRLELGVGAGWMREEFEIVGQPFEKRGKRLDESLEVLRKFEGGGVIEHHGDFFDIPPVRMDPIPKQSTPIYAGGLSKPALRRAAERCDGWAGQIQKQGEMPGLIAELQKLRAASPRKSDPFRIITAIADGADEKAYRELADLGVTDLITVPWIFHGAKLHGSSLEEKCAGIFEFGEKTLKPQGYAAKRDADDG